MPDSPIDDTPPSAPPPEGGGETLPPPGEAAASPPVGALPADVEPPTPFRMLLRGALAGVLTEAVVLALLALTLGPDRVLSQLPGSAGGSVVFLGILAGVSGSLIGVLWGLAEWCVSRGKPWLILAGVTVGSAALVNATGYALRISKGMSPVEATQEVVLRELLDPAFWSVAGVLSLILMGLFTPLLLARSRQVDLAGQSAAMALGGMLLGMLLLPVELERAWRRWYLDCQWVALGAGFAAFFPVCLLLGDAVALKALALLGQPTEEAAGLPRPSRGEMIAAWRLPFTPGEFARRWRNAFDRQPELLRVAWKMLALGSVLQGGIGLLGRRACKEWAQPYLDHLGLRRGEPLLVFTGAALALVLMRFVAGELWAARPAAAVDPPAPFVPPRVRVEFVLALALALYFLVLVLQTEHPEAFFPVVAAVMALGLAAGRLVPVWASALGSVVFLGFSAIASDLCETIGIRLPTPLLHVPGPLGKLGVAGWSLMMFAAAMGLVFWRRQEAKDKRAALLGVIGGLGLGSAVCSLFTNWALVVGAWELVLPPFVWLVAAAPGLVGYRLFANAGRRVPGVAALLGALLLAGAAWVHILVGYGPPVSSLSAKWDYHQAAGGDVEAMLRLASRLRLARGVLERDEQGGMDWLYRAARAGNAQARAECRREVAARRWLPPGGMWEPWLAPEGVTRPEPGDPPPPAPPGRR